MHVWKKALSMILALSLVTSLIVLPASAAGSATVCVDEGLSVKAGETVKVELKVKDNTAFKALQVKVTYPEDILTCKSAAKGADWKAFEDVCDEAGATAIYAANTDVAGEISVSYAADASDADFKGFTGDGAVLVMTFEAAADAESGNAAIEIEVVDADIDAAGSTGSVAIQGAPASIKSLTLEPSAVEVNGTDVTVTATALSTKDKPMSAALSVEPESDDVTIENGKIIVSGKAQAGSYTVTATDENGKTASAGLTVTRAAERKVVTVEGPATITVPKEGKPASTAQYKAMVSNQFGDDPKEAAAQWSVNGAGATIDAATGLVSVNSTADVGTKITVTAVVDGANEPGTKEVELVDMELTPTLKRNPTYGDTWAEIVTNVTAKVGDDTVTGSFKVPSGKPSAGEQTCEVTFTGTLNGVTYEGSVTVTVNVAKLSISPELDDQEEEWTGKEISAGNVKYEVEKTGETVTLLADGKGTDVGEYDVTYTLSEKDAANYVLGEVKGGKLVIVPQKVEVKDEEILEDLTLDGESVRVIWNDKGITLRVQVASGTYTEKTIIDALEDVTKNVRFSITVGEETYTYRIAGWALKDGTTWDKRGTNNQFVPTIAVDKGGDDAVNYAPKLGEFVFIVNATGDGDNSGGSYGGGSAGWNWGDRGNQTINLTPQSIFTDVPDGHTFQKDIVWVYYRNIMKGTTETTFSPASSTNRQQLWMVLGRLSGSNPADMAMAREWAVNTGVSDGSKPTNSLTRQQMVTMLYRWAQSKGYVGVTTGSIAGYNDASGVAAYAKDAMTWAVGNGIINGSGNNLNPGGTATRGQFAAIMHRFCEKFGV